MRATAGSEAIPYFRCCHCERPQGAKQSRGKQESLRAQRSNLVVRARNTGLLRRFAPRNDILKIFRDSKFMSITKLKQLREETGISLIECKKALEQAGSDIEKAKKILREKGQDMIKDRCGRTAGKGIVDSYIHGNGKIGVLLELRCETDFVARAKEFKELAHELCLHIAAMKPLFVRPDDIPENFLDEERKIYQKQFANSGKPEKIVSRIVEGKLNKYKQEVCLLTQLWVKNQDRTIEDLISECAAKLGEKIEVGRFERYEI